MLGLVDARWGHCCLDTLGLEILGIVLLWSERVHEGFCLYLMEG